MNLNQEAEALVRELGLELAVGYDKIRAVLVRLDDEADQEGDRYGYERGLRAALEKARRCRRQEVNPQAIMGAGQVVRAIDRLLEEVGKGRGGEQTTKGGEK